MALFLLVLQVECCHSREVWALNYHQSAAHSMGSSDHHIPGRGRRRRTHHHRTHRRPFPELARGLRPSHWDSGPLARYWASELSLKHWTSRLSPQHWDSGLWASRWKTLFDPEPEWEEEPEIEAIVLALTPSWLYYPFTQLVYSVLVLLENRMLDSHQKSHSGRSCLRLEGPQAECPQLVPIREQEPRPLGAKGQDRRGWPGNAYWMLRRVA